VTRQPPAPDPERPDVPAAPADVPAGTAPPSRSAEGTSELLSPAEGVHAPDTDEPT